MAAFFPMHLHILGICGAFMGGLAAIARAAGHEVTGCDTNVYPPMSTQLAGLGIELTEGYTPEQIDLKPDVFVIGNVVTRGNPLVEEILARGFPYNSGPQWLRENVLAGKWVILPTGACEAHGPHLPLDTDVRIATTMADDAAERCDALVLPALTYGVARFARNFPGTISVSGPTMTALVADVLLSAHAAGAAGLAIANGHLEPANIDALFAACEVVKQRTGATVAFPNVGSRRHAERLSKIVPFDGHAGQYETSLVLAISPRRVRGYKKLPAVHASLGEGIAAGADSFEAAGGPRAYFGRPADASAEAGHRLRAELANILLETMDTRRR